METFFILSLLFALAHSQGAYQSEFDLAVTSNGFPRPTRAQYDGFQKSLSRAKITRKLEAAMYLAQVLHESMGLTKKREIGCEGQSGCVDKYPASVEWIPECQNGNRPGGIGFYGRGYMQLTWCSNYVPASKAIFGDLRLRSNPDQVANSEDLAWGVSAYYWGDRVHAAVANNDQFGLTTKAINGQSEECQGRNDERSKTRFKYYQNVFKAFKLKGTPNPAGCNY